MLQRRALPAPGSDTYEQTTRAFYHGLAALEVGLLDDARQQFTSATTLVPREPASWANLGLAQLRLGELDAAAQPIERALSLAPDNSDLVLLAARMEIARGRLDEGIARLRRAVTLDARGLRTRFALAEELSRLGNAEADTEAQALLDELATRAPANLAIQLERRRLAAKLRDAQRLRESVDCDWPRRRVVARSGEGAVRGCRRRSRRTATSTRRRAPRRSCETCWRRCRRSRKA